jgi:hypothetical protein
VAQLAQGVIHAMFLSKVRFALVAVLVLGALTVAGGRVVFDTPAQGQDRPPEAKAPPPQDRPRVAPEQKSAKTPDPQADARAQLEQARAELTQRMRVLELVERDQSRAMLDLRLKLLVLEEELRGLERTRDTELADYRRRLEQSEKTPALIFGDLPKEIDDLTIRLSDLQKVGGEKALDEIDRLKKNLQQRRHRLVGEAEELRRGCLMIEERFAKKSLVLRQEILGLEEQLRLIERRAGREVNHAEAAVDAAAARVRQIEGLPASGRGNPELERRIEELLRKMAALRKELKRQREGK